nr:MULTISPECIES: phage holin family protein [unclassified Frigoribacterium]
MGDLLGSVTSDISTLFRQEVDLAKAELTESAKKAGKGAGMFGGAGLTGLFALLFLSLAAMWGLGELIGLGWSSLIIAVVYAVVALVLFTRGRKEVKDITGAPKTADSLKKIPETVKPGGH